MSKWEFCSALWFRPLQPLPDVLLGEMSQGDGSKEALLGEFSRSLDHCDSCFWQKNAKICCTAVRETPLFNRKLGSCVTNLSSEARTSVKSTREPSEHTTDINK